MTTFAEAVLDAELELVTKACRDLRLTRDDEEYLLAKHRRKPGLLDLVLVHGGDVRRYCLMGLEARPPQICFR